MTDAVKVDVGGWVFVATPATVVKLMVGSLVNVGTVVNIGVLVLRLSVGILDGVAHDRDGDKKGARTRRDNLKRLNRND